MGMWTRACECGISSGERSSGARTVRLWSPIICLSVLVAVLLGCVPQTAGAVTLLPPEWRLAGVPLGETEGVEWFGHLKLQDEGAPGKPKGIECRTSASGKVTLDGEGEVTTLTTSKCAEAGESPLCESGSSIEARHLPWHSELVDVEGKLQDVLLSDGSGAPAFREKCKTIVGMVEDECTFASGSMALDTTNVVGAVAATFNPSEKLHCTLGGGATGKLETSQEIEPDSGRHLSAVTPSEVEWAQAGIPITGSVGALWKGSLKLQDEGAPGNPKGIECEVGGEGSVGVDGEGDVTTLTVSKCAEAGKSPWCESGSSVEAMHLPWRSELADVEGKAREVLLSGGAGAPGFREICKTIVGMTEDECTAASGSIGLDATNTTSGVTVTFNPSEKLYCTLSGADKGKLEGSQTIEAKSGGKLEVT